MWGQYYNRCWRNLLCFKIAGVWRGAGAGNALLAGGNKAPPCHLPREVRRMWTSENIVTCCYTGSYSIQCWSSGTQLVCACKLLISSLFGFLFYNIMLHCLLLFSFLACKNNHCEETGVILLGCIETLGNNKTSIFRKCARLKYLGMTKGRKTESYLVQSSLSSVFFLKTKI
jgi:hypothetical protein